MNEIQQRCKEKLIQIELLKSQYDYIVNIYLKILNK